MIFDSSRFKEGTGVVQGFVTRKKRRSFSPDPGKTGPGKVHIYFIYMAFLYARL